MSSASLPPPPSPSVDRSDLLLGARRTSETILEVRGLKTWFDTEDGVVHAVDGVSFDVRAGEIVAIVGESGCGKTVTSLSIMDLLPRPAGRIAGGQILFKGQDLVQMDRRQRRRIRGDRISMIFQDPLTALNPVHRIGRQIGEIIRAHHDVSKRAALDRAAELLDLVGIPNARDRVRDYPHQFSGGMRQRAMIAMAIANDPDLLIADEPTTALDVTVQAQILEVLLEVRERLGMAIILITHDLGVVAGMAERVVVMYAGKKVEEGDVESIYERPRHPYTWGLIASTARPDQPRVERLHQIPGAPPSLLDPPAACRFAARCDYVQDVCRTDYPDLRECGPHRQVAACHFAQRDDWTPELTPVEFTERYKAEQGASA